MQVIFHFYMYYFSLDSLISQVECHGRLFVYGTSHLPFPCKPGKDHKIFDHGGCLKLSPKRESCFLVWRQWPPCCVFTGWKEREGSLWSLLFGWKSKVLASQSCLTLYNPMDWSLLGFSVHGILPTSILEWVAIPFSRGSSQPRNQTWVSCIGRQILYCLSHQGSPLSRDQIWAFCIGNWVLATGPPGKSLPWSFRLKACDTMQEEKESGVEHWDSRRHPGRSFSGSSFTRDHCSFSPNKICDSYTSLGFGKAQGRSSQFLAKLTWLSRSVIASVEELAQGVSAGFHDFI